MASMWISAAFSLFAASSADTVHLANGGKITGAITKVVFVKDGQEMVLGKEELADVSELKLSAGGDSLMVDEEEWSGKVKEVRVRSIGGELSFARSKIASVVKELSERERKLAEYKKRSSKLEVDDASGWLKLAKWAESKRLRREAQAAARTSLDIDPEHAKNADAHRMLDHVLRDGRWVTPSEAKEMDAAAEEAKEREMAAKGLVKMGGRWVSPEEKERFEELKERILEMEEDAREEAENWARAKLDEAQQLVNGAQQAVKNAEQRYSYAKAQKAEHAGHGGYCSGYTSAVQQMKQSKETISDEQAKLRRLVGKTRSLATALRGRVDRIKRNTHNAALRLIRKAESGEEIDERTLESELRPDDLD